MAKQQRAILKSFKVIATPATIPGRARDRISLAALFFLFLAPAGGTDLLPKVVVLTTGGTIASKYDAAKGGLVNALSGTQLVEAVPELNKIARIEVEQITNIPSDDMTPDLWLRLSRRTNELLADADVSGVVITHGTDTLEETGYFLDLTVTSSKPVILVGAQRAASYPDSDGPRNILDAVRVAISPEAIGKGSMVVMNGQINAAREVTKTSTIERETFKTLEFGALGVADLEAVRFYRAPLRRQTIPITAETQLGRVEIVPEYAGADGRLIRALLRDEDNPRLAGLVIAGMGLGHVGERTYDAIKEVRDRNIPVVISTRVYTGRTLALYAFKGGGVSLRKIGCISADNLSPQKARILLMLALSKTRNLEELQKYFEH